jgi:SAM-dependent methyltransferase
VLDAGCGNGALLAGLAADGYRMVGIDLLSPGLSRVRRRLPDAWVARAAVDRLPFGDETFDAAVLLDVLEHVDDRAALAAVHRVLRPRGVLIASVPGGPYLWSYRDRDAGHLRRYTKASLRTLLDGSGFAVQCLRPYQALLLPVLLLTRLLGRRGPTLRDLEERPSALVNRILGAITRAELALGRRVPPPFGSSLFVVGAKR